MLSERQIKFRDDFLSTYKQKFYFLKNLPMGLISGVRLIHLDEKKSVAEVPFRWCNKNPFGSMYFAVLSMAAELSTAAPVFMALEGIDIDVAVIIVDLKVEFVKKAQTDVSFQCLDFEKIDKVVAQLKETGGVATITTKSVGRDKFRNDVAIFHITWSFKRRS